MWQSIWWYRWITASFGPTRHRLHAARLQDDSEHRNVSGWVFDVDRYGDTRVVQVREMTLTSEYDDEWFVVRSDVVVTTDDHTYELARRGLVQHPVAQPSRRQGRPASPKA